MGVENSTDNPFEYKEDRSPAETDSEAINGSGGGDMAIFQEDRLTILRQLLSTTYNEETSYGYKLKGVVDSSVNSFEYGLEEGEKALPVWFRGKACNYEGESLDVQVQLSYNEFDSVNAGVSASGRYQISGKPPEQITIGADVDQEHPQGSQVDVRIVPNTGVEQRETNIELSNSQEYVLDATYSRIVAKVYDAKGNPLEGVTVKDKGTGNLYKTDLRGSVTFDLPSGERTLSGLRNSVEKTLSIGEQELVEIEFRFAGVELTYVNNQGDPIGSANVYVEEKNGDHEEVLETDYEGVATDYLMNPNKTYEFEVQGFTKDEPTLGEGTIIKITNQAQEGWNSPEGYSNVTGDITVEVVDENTRKTVQRLPITLKSEDGDVEFEASINTNDKGRGTFVAPINAELDVVVSEYDKRYLKTEYSYELSDSEAELITVEAKRRSATVQS